MTARRRLLAGNWKMNKTNAELDEFFRTFIGESSFSSSGSVDVLFAVPYTMLAKAQSLVGDKGISIAAQNVHWEAKGAYTGEISTSMLKDVGVSAAVIGHSERRQYFGETDATVKARTVACLDAGILPVVCVGETKDERQANQTEAVVSRQINAIIAEINDPKEMVIAYEPVWAIGTGLTASDEQAQEVHAMIRGLLSKRYGDTGSKMRILYGGSAKPSNIEGLISQADIDGGLVGGASLVPTDFAAMYKSMG